MRLVTVAHGTRHGPGNDVARRLTSLAGRQLGLTAVASYVELCEPSLQSVLAGSSEADRGGPAAALERPPRAP